ncbi:MAG: hypothetical protein DRJ52_02120 [Thermoprotei archaeon]|nr:MAG: hypothetical protein DRJ52_02120 [Thermoprotei archaeon]HDI74780.1 hypothetical protein [Thermoprotei archaeon]
MRKPRVGLIFSAVPSERRTWPYVGYDYKKRAEELEKLIKENLPEIEFVAKLVQSRDDVEKIFQEIGEVDGYVIYYIGIWLGATEAILKKNKPTILVDDLYAGSGEFLLEYSKAKRKGYSVLGVAATNIKDIIKYIRLLDVVYRFKNSKIVVVTDRKIDDEYRETIEEEYGLKLIQYSSSKLNEVYENTNDEEAKRWKEKWIREAERILETSEEEVFKAAKMYLALKKIIEKEKADAITVDCLALVYGGKILAYPCLAFFQLNNDGYVATCEADIDSAATMLLIKYLTGRPSFVSDPVIDLSSNQVIYAHCVAPSKVYGPGGHSAKYILRTHAEDRSGVSVQVLMPLGEKVTTVKLNLRERTMSIHSGKIVANVEEEKACRTKVAVETDAYNILENWNMYSNFGWHRVTVVGDYRREFINIARLLRLKVIEEDKTPALK